MQKFTKVQLKKKETALRKEKARYAKALALVPKIHDLNPNGRKKQISVKNKRKIIKHMVMYGLTPKETAIQSGASVSQIYAWRKDFEEGRLHSKTAIAVTRRSV